MTREMRRLWTPWIAAGCGLLAGGTSVELLHRAGSLSNEVTPVPVSIAAPAPASMELCWDESQLLDSPRLKRFSYDDTLWPRRLETRNFSTYNPKVAREDMFQLGRDGRDEAPASMPNTQIDLLFPQERLGVKEWRGELGDPGSFCFTTTKGTLICIDLRA
jgi:hypothetical protein